MILLRATTDDLRITVGTTGSDIEVHMSAMVADSASPPALKAIPDLGPQASITTNVTNQVLIDSSAISGIASGDSVNVESCSVYNNHATVSTTVELNITDATVTTVLAKVTLLAGESLVLTEGGVWLHYDSNGGLYPSIGNAASQAEMEAAAATDKYVTPAGMNFHPGVAKCWGKANGAGTSLLVNRNIASISDTGTGRLGWTIGTDFSSADWSAHTSLQRVSTLLSVANTDNGGMFRNAGQTAGAIETENFDDTATTHVAQDPEFYHVIGFGDQA